MTGAKPAVGTTLSKGERRFAAALVARLLFVLVTLGAPTAAQAFVTLRPAADTLETATRWAAAPHAAVGGAGLYDGLSVAIEPDLAETLAIAVTGEALAEDVAAIEIAVAAAFAAWESPVIVFDIEFDGPVMQGAGIGEGAEIDVFVRPETDPVFIDNNFFGRTQSVSQLVTERVLTNGTVLAGRVTQRADIFLNVDMIQFFAAVLTREQQPAALQRLLMHEIGHAMGFHHPNEFQSANYDTDLDPLNEMAIDPANPLADLMLSPNLDGDAIMSNRPAVGRCTGVHQLAQRRARRPRRAVSGAATDLVHGRLRCRRHGQHRRAGAQHGDRAAAGGVPRLPSGRSQPRYDGDHRRARRRRGQRARRLRRGQLID